MEKYGDKHGVFMALKHLLRKPKVAVPGADTPRAGLSADQIRIQDIKKAINYLQREVDLAEGTYKKTIQ
jgi:cytochrome c2